LNKYILDYRKKQAETLRISENVIFTKYDVMKYVIGALHPTVIQLCLAVVFKCNTDATDTELE